MCGLKILEFKNIANLRVRESKSLNISLAKTTYVYPNIFSFYLKNIRNLDITDLLKNAGFPEVEAFLSTCRGFMVQ